MTWSLLSLAFTVPACYGLLLIIVQIEARIVTALGGVPVWAP